VAESSTASWIRPATLLLTLLAQSAAAATITVDVASHTDSIEVQASALLDADADSAWRVLTDYERYVDFIPGLHESRILARKGATVTVEQSGDAVVWLLHVPLDVTFEITEIAPTRLDSRVVAGDLHALDSHYVLAREGNRVRLEYVGKLASGFVLFGPLEGLAVKENIARRFQALADEIERRFVADRARSGLGRLDGE
jgi:ribosome-associated toxin RatA of RatAB toxin-antitoxin module